MRWPIRATGTSSPGTISSWRRRSRVTPPFPPRPWRARPTAPSQPPGMSGTTARCSRRRSRLRSAPQAAGAQPRGETRRLKRSLAYKSGTQRALPRESTPLRIKIPGVTGRQCQGVTFAETFFTWQPRHCGGPCCLLEPSVPDATLVALSRPGCRGRACAPGRCRAGVAGNCGGARRSLVPSSNDSDRRSELAHPLHPWERGADRLLASGVRRATLGSSRLAARVSGLRPFAGPPLGNDDHASGAGRLRMGASSSGHPSGPDRRLRQVGRWRSGMPARSAASGCSPDPRISFHERPFLRPGFWRAGFPGSRSVRQPCRRPGVPRAASAPARHLRRHHRPPAQPDPRRGGATGRVAPAPMWTQRLSTGVAIDPRLPRTPRAPSCARTIVDSPQLASAPATPGPGSRAKGSQTGGSAPDQRGAANSSTHSRASRISICTSR
jgi:hypothetical protein